MRAGPVAVPLLHIADTTARAVLASGRRRVALLGTALTMEQPFLRERRRASGLEVVVPEADARARVHAMIYDELCRGIVRPESRAVLVALIEDLVADGTQGVILGCTELELLLDPDSPVAGVPLYPSARLHALAALDAALG